MARARTFKEMNGTLDFDSFDTLSSRYAREGGQKLPILCSKKTTKRREGVKNS